MYQVEHKKGYLHVQLPNGILNLQQITVSVVESCNTLICVLAVILYVMIVAPIGLYVS